MKETLFIISLLIPLLFTACSEPEETPTKGSLIVYTDESILPLVIKEKDSFTSLYPQTVVDVVPLNARDGIAKLMNGEIEMYLSSRNFTNDEQNNINNHHISIKTYDFCYGGIAVITSKSGLLRQISLDELKDLLVGKSKSYKLYMPGNKTGLYEFVRNEYLDGRDPAGAILLPGDAEIKDAVKNDVNGIGLTGFNLVKDTTEIRVVPVGLLNYQTHKIVYHKPHPAYFLNSTYPLTRELYIFLNEKHFGVATGFTSFLTSTDGQKVVLSENLAPASVPVKIVSH